MGSMSPYIAYMDPMGYWGIFRDFPAAFDYHRIDEKEFFR